MCISLWALLFFVAVQSVSCPLLRFWFWPWCALTCPHPRLHLPCERLGFSSGSVTAVRSLLDHLIILLPGAGPHVSLGSAQMMESCPASVPCWDHTEPGDSDRAFCADTKQNAPTPHICLLIRWKKRQDNTEGSVCCDGFTAVMNQLQTTSGFSNTWRQESDRVRISNMNTSVWILSINRLRLEQRRVKTGLWHVGLKNKSNRSDQIKFRREVVSFVHNCSETCWSCSGICFHFIP